MFNLRALVPPYLVINKLLINEQFLIKDLLKRVKKEKSNASPIRVRDTG